MIEAKFRVGDLVKTGNGQVHWVHKVVEPDLHSSGVGNRDKNHRYEITRVGATYDGSNLSESSLALANQAKVKTEIARVEAELRDLKGYLANMAMTAKP